MEDAVVVDYPGQRDKACCQSGCLKIGPAAGAGEKAAGGFIGLDPVIASTRSSAATLKAVEVSQGLDGSQGVRGRGC